MIRRSITLLAVLFSFTAMQSQSFRIEDIPDMFGKGKALKLNGNFSANSSWNMGDGAMGRDPWAYYLNGSLNLNILGLIDMPFSFSLTNSGSSYKLPSSPNRLSISPSYKWATAHIGDVSMVFSPYTLNGHIFTGAGIELTPGDWEFSAMYGRLLKTVEYDTLQPSILPTYRRMAYGVKAGKKAEKYEISVNMLNAWDNVSSLSIRPDSLGIMPMKNLSGSLAFMFKPVSYISITGEYGLSLLTQDKRASNTTSRYNAFKAQVNLVGENNHIGIGYERIDPGYKTLGAYYFVNDLENITINASQTFWQKKMALNISIGYEHDDLAKNKANASSRIVSSINLTTQFSERVNSNISYSNFQSYTNVRSNFELINQENPLDLLDTLNFVQLSQNANLNLSIITMKSERRQDNLNLNFSYQDAASKQGGIYQLGSVSEMINGAAVYSLNFLQSGLILNGALNMNNSRIQNANAFTWGPTAECGFKLFKKKVNMRTSVSYNTGLLKGVKQNEVFLYRLNSAYTFLKKQNITGAYSFQRRSAINRPPVNFSLLTIGYSYSF